MVLKEYQLVLVLPHNSCCLISKEMTLFFEKYKYLYMALIIHGDKSTIKEETVNDYIKL